MTPQLTPDALARIATSLGYAYGAAGHAVPDRDAVILGESVASHLRTGNDAGRARRAADTSTAVAVEDGERPWGERLAQRRAEPVATLDEELIPDRLRPWVVDVAARFCLPVEVVAVPVLVALGSLIGRSVVIRPDIQSDWTTPPNLWGAIVARPGSMKSAALGKALSPIGKLEARARDLYEEDHRAMEARRRWLTATLKQVERRKGSTEQEIRELLDDIESCTANEKRYRTSDPTVEKLGELMIANPRGLLLVRDELGGWISSMKKAGREGDREFYLEAWGGDSSFTVDRIGRGTLHIPSLCLSVVGAIQPGKLRRHVEDAVTGGVGDDGLLQRFQLLVYPDDAPDWNRCDGEPDTDAKRQAAGIYYDADEMCTEPWPEPIRFGRAAQEIYDRWRDRLEILLRSHRLSDAPAFESHIAKYRGLVPSLALIFHVIESGMVRQIAPEHIDRAIAWSEFLESHARKVYAADLSPEIGCARVLAARIEDGTIADMTPIRDLARAGWRGLRSPEQVNAAVRELELTQWVRVESHKPARGGRPSVVIRVHPELRRGA